MLRKIFDEKIPHLNAPIPCPTRAHTFDFNCTYMGAHLIDGECKGESTPAAASVLVLHSAKQLAYNQYGLSMLTTNESITFYSSQKDTDAGQI